MVGYASWLEASSDPVHTKFLAIMPALAMQKWVVYPLLTMPANANAQCERTLNDYSLNSLFTRITNDNEANTRQS